MSLLKSTEKDLFDAVHKGDAARVGKLLAKDLYVDAQNKGGHTPLLEASSRDNLDVVQILLDRGANVNQLSETDAALVIAEKAMAAKFGWSDSNLPPAMRTLVGKSNGTKGGSTPLMYASAFGHVHVVKTLLASQGIDVNARNKAGATALSIAQAGDRSDHKKIAEILEAAGAHS